MLNLLAHITPEYLLYLFYGAAFLFLGVSITSKDMKGSDLELADNLWLLAMFGYFHGAHEWLELGLLIEGEHLHFQQIVLLKAISTGVVVLSFIFLLGFGLALVRVQRKIRMQWTWVITSSLFLIWMIHVSMYGLYGESRNYSVK